MRRHRVSYPSLLVAIAAGLLLLAALPFVHGSFKQASAAPPPVEWLHVEGNKVVNQSGQTVVLRGVNLENREWEWAFRPNIDFERRAIPVATGHPDDGGWGSNVVLLAVASGPINRNDSTYLNYLDELVALSKAHGAYTLLVWRYGEPNTSQPNMPNQAAEDAMARLATRYASEPAVLYGLQVEPHNVSWSQLKPRFITMIDAIRDNNPKALIFVPGTQWSRYVYWALDDPIPRDNLVYKPHVYDPWDTDPGRYRLEEVAAKYPVVIGEFGAGGRMSLDGARSMIDVAEANGIGWIAWLFHHKGGPYLLVNEFTPTAYGALVRDRLRAAYVAGPPAPVDPTYPDLPLRINTGGGAVTDSAGNAWLADQAYTAPSGFGYLEGVGPSAPANHGLDISGTADSAIFSTERWSMSGYRVNVPDGTYDVRLSFAETWSGITGSGERVFDVRMQGSTVLNSLDVYEEAGFASALIKDFQNVTVTGGALDIEFNWVTQNPMIKGIEVMAAGSLEPAASPTPTATASPDPTPTATPNNPGNGGGGAGAGGGGGGGAGAGGGGGGGPSQPDPTPTATPDPEPEPTATPPSTNVVFQMSAANVVPGAVFEVPITAKGVPEPGLAGLDMEITYDQTNVQLLGVKPGDAPWTDNLVNIDKDAGTVRIVNAKTSGTSGNFVVAVLQMKAMGNSGSTVLKLRVPGAAGADARVIPVTVQSGVVTFVDGVVTQAQVIPGKSSVEGTSGILVQAPGVFHPVTGARRFDVPVTGYSFELAYNPALAQVLDVHLPAVDGAVSDIDNDAGAATFVVPNNPGSDLSPFIALRLTGPVTQQTDVTLGFEAMVDGGFPAEISHAEAAVMRFQRADILPDGEINVMDAIAGLQYLAGLREAGAGPDQVNVVNFASIRHDNGADMISVMDVVVLLQYLAGLRDDHLMPK